MLVSKIISGIFHPLFMPLYGIILIFEFNSYINYFISEREKLTLVLFLLFFTIILPTLIIYIFKKLKLITDFYLEKKEERRWPFISTIICYFICLEFFVEMKINFIFYLLTLGAMLILIIAHLITLKWKISAHMIGIGGLIGGLIGLSQRFEVDNVLVIISLIIISGVIGYARLKTKAHNYQQVYTGFILGLLAEWFIVVYF